ncbi:unnamed protein product [Nezara viridula]|uniref:Uncharacterized protein n=1 Tax=Nezara viridula TaxID=85310 RepID=A0A9P0EBD7_NEZVI|nr:unnamed protein product [Nezara viridula]
MALSAVNLISPTDYVIPGESFQTNGSSKSQEAQKRSDLQISRLPKTYQTFLLLLPDIISLDGIEYIGINTLHRPANWS